MTGLLKSILLIALYLPNPNIHQTISVLSSMVTDTSEAGALYSAGSWTSESEAIGSPDTTYMYVTSKNIDSGVFDTYSFSITAGSTITGIRIRFYGYCGDTNDYFDISIRDNTSTYQTSGSAAPGTSRVQLTMGGDGQLWGGTWDAAHFNSNGFRIYATSRASGGAGGDWEIDNFECTVYYTEPSGNPQVIIIICN